MHQIKRRLTWQKHITTCCRLWLYYQPTLNYKQIISFRIRKIVVCRPIPAFHLSINYIFIKYTHICLVTCCLWLLLYHNGTSEASMAYEVQKDYQVSKKTSANPSLGGRGDELHVSKAQSTITIAITINQSSRNNIHTGLYRYWHWTLTGSLFFIRACYFQGRILTYLLNQLISRVTFLKD